MSHQVTVTKNPLLWGEQDNQIVNNFSVATPRETAIVGVALVEAMLDQALRKQFIANADSRLLDKLLTFESKVQLAHALSYISDSLRNDLSKLGPIRNHFAHSASAFDFDSNLQNVKDENQIPHLCNVLASPIEYQDMFKWMCKRVFNVAAHDQHGLEGIFVVDSGGCVIVGASPTSDDRLTNRGKFLFTIKVIRVLMYLLSSQKIVS